MRIYRAMTSAILLGLTTLFVLSACSSQPTPAAPTSTIIAATPAPPVEASATPDAAREQAALAERALLSLEALDKETGFTFKVSTDSLVEQKLSQNGTAGSSWTTATSLLDQGSFAGPAGSRMVSLQRAIYFPGSQALVPIEGEARLVENAIFVRSSYKGNAAPGEASFPQGWVKINGPASLLYWPAYRNIFMKEMVTAVGSDAGALLTGQPTRVFHTAVFENLAGAERAWAELDDAGAVETITLTLKSPALMQTVVGIDLEDPINVALLEATQGEPVTVKFTLDSAGKLIRLDCTSQVNVKDMDISSFPGGQPGLRLTVTGTQTVAARVLPLDPFAPAVPLPGEGQMAKSMGISTRGEEKMPDSFVTLNQFDERLNAAIQAGAVDDFWKEIQALGRMPLIFGDTAVFLYRGNAKSVSWSGDWNNVIPTIQRRLSDTDLWMCAGQFPLDARLEYQLVLDGGQGVIDQLNPLSEVGGLATKSVLLMPDYVEPAFTTLQPGVPQGKLTDNLTLSSASLGYDVNYRVYTPVGYPQSGRLPAIYITDGQDYLKFGRMEAILDNLIAEKKIKPVVAVFIDPRDTKTGDNLREKQFLDNPKFADFIATELVPAVEKAYKLDPSPDARAILGASYGGYFSASFALRHADQFHLIGIQSPAFWYNPALMDEYKNARLLPLKIFMNTGVMNDTSYHARLMRDVFQSKGYTLHYVESNEGHSYGNWRGKMDQLLIFFFGEKANQ